MKNFWKLQNEIKNLHLFDSILRQMKRSRSRPWKAKAVPSFVTRVVTMVDNGKVTKVNTVDYILINFLSKFRGVQVFTDTVPSRTDVFGILK